MANLNDKLVDYKSLKENTKLTLGEALAYDKGLAGGYNGDFPLTVATKGNIYRVPATNKFYMCITDYNGSNLTAPNANFEELSVWANRDKLENLIILTEPDSYKSGAWNNIPYPAGPSRFTPIPVICNYEDENYFIILNNTKTQFRTHSQTGDKKYAKVSFIFLRIDN